jgi:hypothetical protein
MTATHTAKYASPAADGCAAPAGNGMPMVGSMVRPFPEPGATVRVALAQLQLATIDPPADEAALCELAQLPRPWDPGSCAGQMRAEVWAWLDAAAMWVNEQHLWNVTRPGIPECWPAHPHLVHDLAVLACSRHFTKFAITPSALEDWHRFALPGFLERLRDRMGDSCQPGRHQPRPRHERDETHSSAPVRRDRERRYRADLDVAVKLAETVAQASDGDLHKRW